MNAGPYVVDQRGNVLLGNELTTSVVAIVCARGSDCRFPQILRSHSDLSALDSTAQPGRVLCH